MLHRWRQRIWPTITDSDSACAAIRGAVKISAAWAAVSLLLAIAALHIGLTHPPISPGQIGEAVGSLVDAMIFGLLAWKIRRMSRPWAITGLVFTILMMPFALSSLLAILFHAAVLIAFIGAVRATTAFRRFEAERVSQLTDAERLMSD
jgi:FtsH-binding integral membrane protein